MMSYFGTSDGWWLIGMGMMVLFWVGIVLLADLGRASPLPTSDVLRT